MIRKTKDICKLKIQGYDDRAKMVSILANSGYDVRIEEEVPEKFSALSSYFVIVSNAEEGFIGFEKDELKDGISVSDLLVMIGFAKDKSEGKRLIMQGAIYINSKKIEGILDKITEKDFVDGKLSLKKGKTKFADINLIQ